MTDIAIRIENLSRTQIKQNQKAKSVFICVQPCPYSLLTMSNIAIRVKNLFRNTESLIWDSAGNMVQFKRG